MSDRDVVEEDDLDIDAQEEQDERRARRRRGLIAVILLLLLLMCCCTTVSQVWLTGGREQARFLARNIECLECHTDLIPDFSEPAVHDPFALQQCTTCHVPHGKKVSVTSATVSSDLMQRFSRILQWAPIRWWLSLSESDAAQVGSSSTTADPSTSSSKSIKATDSGLIMPETELCWTCHGSMGAKLGDEFPHEPFAAGRCTNCHNPHASKYKSLLLMAPQDLCFTCHPMVGELDRMQTHPPAKEGRCLECHDPHASNYQGMLVSSQRVLCTRCHPSVELKSTMAIQHVPFLNGDCTGCHQPHGSRYTPLLNAVQPDLCYQCHDSTEKDFRRPSHHPVGGTFMCTSCHDPHAAQYLNLVAATGNNFCYQCHEQKRELYDTSSHAPVRCDRCHTSHGSNNVPLLQERNPSLCFQCHSRSGFDERTHSVANKNHPVRGAHYDVNAEAPLTCTSSCHDPHGTRLNRMLRYFDYHRDGTCLMCHAVTQGSRVGIDY